MKLVATIVLAAIAAASAASAGDRAAADIVNTDGAVIGKATFEQTPGGGLITVEAAGLPPGGHGIHLHAVGACTPDFKAAAGHINPGRAKHGLRNRDGPDNGDLPNLYAAADGTVRAEFFTSCVTVVLDELRELTGKRHERPTRFVSLTCC